MTDSEMTDTRATAPVGVTQGSAIGTPDESAATASGGGRDRAPGGRG